jgi:hypothetical protein
VVIDILVAFHTQSFDLHLNAVKTLSIAKRYAIIDTETQGGGRGGGSPELNQKI